MDKNSGYRGVDGESDDFTARSEYDGQNDGNDSEYHYVDPDDQGLQDKWSEIETG